MDDLRTTERAAIQTHAEEIAEAKADRTAKSKQRGECRATLKQLDETAAEASDADTKKATAIRKEHKQTLHKCIDAGVAERVQRLNAAVSNKDTQQLWMKITASIEAGFVEHFQLKGAQSGQDQRQKQGQDHAQHARPCTQDRHGRTPSQRNCGEQA